MSWLLSVRALERTYGSGERLTALMRDSMAASGPRTLSRLWKASAAPPAGWGENCSAVEETLVQRRQDNESHSFQLVTEATERKP